MFNDDTCMQWSMIAEEEDLSTVWLICNHLQLKCVSLQHFLNGMFKCIDQIFCLPPIDVTHIRVWDISNLHVLYNPGLSATHNRLRMQHRLMMSTICCKQAQIT